MPSRLQPGSFYALPQSPQIFKQLLMVGGLERYFQIARCFRDEDQRADRQPEFTQLDVELSFVTEEDVLGLTEEVMSAVFAVGGFAVAAPPWPRIGYAEAMARFGSDRPDTRFGLELHDVGELVRGCEFKVFNSVLEGGGVVRAINAGARELSRAEQDGLSEFVQRYGAKAVAPITVGEGGWRGNLAKFFSDQQIAAVNAELGASDGDLLLFVADRAAVAAQALGALRLELAERFGLIDPRSPRRALGGRLPDVRVRRGGRALDRRAPPVHRSRAGRSARASSTSRTRARCARAATTSSSTAPSWAAARFAATPPRSSSRCSRRSASRRRRRRRASASCSTRCATAPRRTAASRSESTASSR